MAGRKPSTPSRTHTEQRRRRRVPLILGSVVIVAAVVTLVSILAHRARTAEYRMRRQTLLKALPPQGVMLIPLPPSGVDDVLVYLTGLSQSPLHDSLLVVVSVETGEGAVFASTRDRWTVWRQTDLPVKGWNEASHFFSRVFYATSPIIYCEDPPSFASRLPAPIMLELQRYDEIWHRLKVQNLTWFVDRMRMPHHAP